MTITSRNNNILDRMKRAMKMEDSLYAEVEHDPVASKQGLYIIALVSVSQAIGRGLETVIAGRPLDNILVTGIFGFIETIIGLAVWSYVLYFIGDKIMKATVTPPEIWRCTGFARSLESSYIIPFIGPLVNIWIFMAYLKAGKQALNLSTGKTLLAVIISATALHTNPRILDILLITNILREENKYNKGPPIPLLCPYPRMLLRPNGEKTDDINKIINYSNSICLCFT